MTLSKIISDARYRLNAADDDLWGDEELTSYFNWAKDKLMVELSRMKSTDNVVMKEFTTVSGTQSYIINGSGGIVPEQDFFDVVKIFNKDTVQSLPVRNLEQKNTYSYIEKEPVYTYNASASFCYIVGNSLYFAPTPSSAITYEFWYHKRAADFDYDDDLEVEPDWLNAAFHYIISILIAIRMAEKDERDTTKLGKEYDDAIEEYKSFLRRQRDNRFIYEPSR